MIQDKTSPRALLVYPKFPPSYWNMDFLCSLDGRKVMAPPLGLVTVAALLPQEWDLKLRDENLALLTQNDWDWSEVVLLSAMIIQRGRLHDLIRQAKAQGKTVVVGGAYPTVMPEEILAWGADIVVRGEFENLVIPFLEAFQANRSGVVLESPKKPDLTTSPIPRFDLLHLQDYAMLAMQTTRGCPFDCEFCDVVSLFGRKPRHKTPEQVLAELEAMYRLGWRGVVFISDDNFIGNKAYARDLLHRMTSHLKDFGEPFGFFTQASVDLGQERELIDLMTEANFSSVIIGIESPEEEVLKFTHKLHNVRHPLVESVNTITANGLNVIASFILGFDQEKSGAGERIADFVEATSIPIVVLNLLVPFPRTRLWDRLKREGRLREDRLQSDSHNVDIFCGQLAFRPSRPETEILDEYLHLWERLYDRSNFLSRTYRYYLSMRPTRRALARAQQGAPPLAPIRRTKPLKVNLKDIKSFLRLSWANGVIPSCRRQYWSQFAGLRRQNPSRLIRYFETLAMGEDMFPLREVVRQRLGYLRDNASSVAG